MLFKELFLILFIGLSLLILLANSTHGQSSNAYKSWTEERLPKFSFFVPPGTIYKPIKGKDSEIWKYSTENLILTIDLGIHSGKPIQNLSASKYTEKQMKIDKENATLVFFNEDEPAFQDFPYVIAIYFSGIGSSETTLSFVTHCKTLKERKIAMKIFNSIKFAKNKTVGK